jgi:hypothetical protein
MNIRLPNWPMSSVIKLACDEWTILHPNNPADPVTSPWILVMNAVDCWARHQWSQYNKEVTAETRDKLHEEIRRAARCQYGWLRGATDPRPTVQSSQDDPKLLTGLGIELNAHVERRALLLRQRRLTSDRDERAKIDAELKDIDRQSELGRELYTIARTGKKHGKEGFVASAHHHNEYLFGGRPLPPSFTKPAWITCARCGAAVQRSKRPVDIGGGVKANCWACLCISVSGPECSCINEPMWNAMLENHYASGPDRESFYH